MPICTQTTTSSWVWLRSAANPPSHGSVRPRGGGGVPVIWWDQGWEWCRGVGRQILGQVDPAATLGKGGQAGSHKLTPGVSRSQVKPTSLMSKTQKLELFSTKRSRDTQAQSPKRWISWNEKNTSSDNILIWQWQMALASCEFLCGSSDCLLELLHREHLWCRLEAQWLGGSQ